ncbi:hypothetical protein BJX62DRAFT_211078 [Aspergillus germanicus]
MAIHLGGTASCLLYTILLLSSFSQLQWISSYLICLRKYLFYHKTSYQTIQGESIKNFHQKPC